jgi:hypothetical protein
MGEQEGVDFALGISTKIHPFFNTAMKNRSSAHIMGI